MFYERNFPESRLIFFVKLWKFLFYIVIIEIYYIKCELGFENCSVCIGLMFHVHLEFLRNIYDKKSPYIRGKDITAHSKVIIRMYYIKCELYFEACGIIRIFPENRFDWFIYSCTARPTLSFGVYRRLCRELTSQFWSDLPRKWQPDDSHPATIPQTYTYKPRLSIHRFKVPVGSVDIALFRGSR